MLRTSSGEVDGLVAALARRSGPEAFATSLSAASGLDTEPLLEVTRALLSEPVLLTGAEAAALVLADAEIELAFAYAGTSELALCDATARTPGIELVNGRGDKESAFMAAGANLLRPRRGVAIIHGARGLTNAGGAIADARKNDIGLVALVGLPSSSSVRFLPPHADPDLIHAMGHFAAWADEIGPIPVDPADATAHASQYVAALRDAIAAAWSVPAGPALLGVPQDIAERRWVPVEVIESPVPARAGHAIRDHELADVVVALDEATAPVVLVDDYALKYTGAGAALRRFSERFDAPILQVRYQRGPMLFERLRYETVPSFLGWHDPGSAEHRRLMDDCDLLVTVEDHNIYERVVGTLPSARKLAITSSVATVRKNEYLQDGDLTLEGAPPALLGALASAPRTDEPRGPWWEPVARITRRGNPDAQRFRASVAGAVSAALGRLPRPVIVDDSQMLGGLLSEEYDELPLPVRVFGDHGGFVGGGLSVAAGLAQSEPGVAVLCTLGDQGFTNAFQGLVAVAQEQAPVVFVVANNGRSVSLLKQARAVDERMFDGGAHRHLLNPDLTYAQIGAALGIPTRTVVWSSITTQDVLDAATRSLQVALDDLFAKRAPGLIELILPSDPHLWDGVWITAGFEAQPQPAAA
ncbi:thiamine pyrophosphate-dependent enzyme [Svornostia abyssi]|uniref:Thiamine pyrophosphate-dependent enzyme n=1 Tax=Svornostia abyssi TaxID=2898438 RepID=A0ABY5PHN5_9ACTN|nr:thiamine pyrophosphate-dependent enzyme [Parviterribacteraceae bacterium J379]